MVTTGEVHESESGRRIALALDFIQRYGGTDGAHHKTWVLDQVARALHGCPMVTRESADYRGRPYTYEDQGESESYLAWVAECRAGEDGPETYDYDVGIAP